MKFLPLFFVSAACVCVCHLSVSVQGVNPPNLEYRMSPVPAHNGDVPSTRSISRVVNEAREYHLNALLPVAFLQGEACYASCLVPVYHPANMDPPLDALAELIRLAHDTSGGKPYIEIHPRVALFSLGLEPGLPPREHPVLTRREWLTGKKDDRELPPGEIPREWLDPGVPGVCDLLVQLCKEIVAGYNVDGLNLDDVRYYEGGYGYNAIALDRFRKRTKRTDIPMPRDPLWQAWQREQVTNLVRRIYAETKLINPRLKLSVCSIVWGDPEKHPEQQDFYTRVLQDWPSWFHEGIADINLPMNFRNEDRKSEKREFLGWTVFCKNHYGDRLFVNGLGSYMNALSGSAAQVVVTRQIGAGGVCLFQQGIDDNKGRASRELLDILRREVFPGIAGIPETPWLDKPDTGIIRGFVYRSDKSRVVDGIKMTLLSAGMEVFTDGSGYYAFVHVVPGNYEIQASMDSEIISKRKIAVKSGEMVTMNFDLLGLVEHRL